MDSYQFGKCWKIIGMTKIYHQIQRRFQICTKYSTLERNLYELVENIHTATPQQFEKKLIQWLSALQLSQIITNYERRDQGDGVFEAGADLGKN